MLDFTLDTHLEMRLRALSNKTQRSKRQLTKEALIKFLDQEEPMDNGHFKVDSPRLTSGQTA